MKTITFRVSVRFLAAAAAFGSSKITSLNRIYTKYIAVFPKQNKMLVLNNTASGYLMFPALDLDLDDKPIVLSDYAMECPVFFMDIEEVQKALKTFNKGTTRIDLVATLDADKQAVTNIKLDKYSFDVTDTAADSYNLRHCKDIFVFDRLLDMIPKTPVAAEKVAANGYAVGTDNIALWAKAQKALFRGKKFAGGQFMPVRWSSDRCVVVYDNVIGLFMYMKYATPTFSPADYGLDTEQWGAWE